MAAYVLNGSAWKLKMVHALMIMTFMTALPSDKTNPAGVNFEVSSFPISQSFV